MPWRKQHELATGRQSAAAAAAGWLASQPGEPGAATKSPRVGHSGEKHVKRSFAKIGSSLVSFV